MYVCGQENIFTLIILNMVLCATEQFVLVFYIIILVSFFVYVRAEMLCKVEEVRREMESRLDSQRRHMVQKESQLKNEVEELKVTCESL